MDLIILQRALNIISQNQLKYTELIISMILVLDDETYEALSKRKYDTQLNAIYSEKLDVICSSFNIVYAIEMIDILFQSNVISINSKNEIRLNINYLGSEKKKITDGLIKKVGSYKYAN